MDYSKDYWFFEHEGQDGVNAAREFMASTGLCRAFTEEEQEKERTRTAEVREHFNSQSITVRELSGWCFAFDPKRRMRDALLYPEELDSHENGTSVLEKIVSFSQTGTVLGILADRTRGKGGLLYYTEGECRRRRLSGNLPQRAMLYGSVPYVLHSLPYILQKIRQYTPETAKQLFCQHLVIVHQATGNMHGSTHAWLGLWTRKGRGIPTDKEAYKIHTMKTILPFLESFHTGIESFYKDVLVSSDETHATDKEATKERLLISGYALLEALVLFAEQMEIHTKGSELLEEVGPPLLVELAFDELDWGSADYFNAIVHDVTEYLYIDTLHEGEFTERMPYLK